MMQSIQICAYKQLDPYSPYTVVLYANGDRFKKGVNTSSNLYVRRRHYSRHRIVYNFSYCNYI